MLDQRVQYAKGGVGRGNWVRRDLHAFRGLVGKRILDAGCGQGITLERIENMFVQVVAVGVDRDIRALRQCQNLGLSVLETDLQRLPFDSGFFDSCLLLEVIEHLSETWNVLLELNRVLRSYGRLVIVFPNDILMFAARLFCGKWQEAMEPTSHLRHGPFKVSFVCWSVMVFKRSFEKDFHSRDHGFSMDSWLQKK